MEYETDVSAGNATIQTRQSHNTEIKSDMTVEYFCECKPLAVKKCCADNCPRILNNSGWATLSAHCLYRQARTR